MSVLVTGGAGYIGSHAVLALLDRGEKVVVLDDLSFGFRWAVPAEAELVVGDIADTALVEATLRRHRVTEIVHFAARILVAESVADPLALLSRQCGEDARPVRGGDPGRGQAGDFLIHRFRLWRAEHCSPR